MFFRPKFLINQKYLDTFTVLNGDDPALKKHDHLISNKLWNVEIDRTALHLMPPVVSVPVYGITCLEKNCPTMVSIGGPFCAKHTEKFYSVVAKQTTLKNNGVPLPFQGLFATRDFEAGEKIIPYFHLCLFTPTPTCSVVVPDPYSMLVNGGTHSALQFRCAGALANTILGKPRLCDLGRKVAKSAQDLCNVKFLITSEVDLVATKLIRKGQELFADYGPKRFEFMDLRIENSKELQQQEDNEIGS
jgi:hypothetical protein